MVMAMRLVPLAMPAGKPMSISTDREIMLPPPASVLMNPTIKPAVIRMIISTVVMLLKINRLRKVIPCPETDLCSLRHPNPAPGVEWIGCRW